MLNIIIPQNQMQMAPFQPPATFTHVKCEAVERNCLSFKSEGREVVCVLH